MRISCIKFYSDFEYPLLSDGQKRTLICQPSRLYSPTHVGRGRHSDPFAADGIAQRQTLSSGFHIQ